MYFITKKDENCKRMEYDGYYAWEIAPDLLGCGTSIELSDTHVTFVNSLSTKFDEQNQIRPVNGIIFGNQAPIFENKIQKLYCSKKLYF